MKNRKRREKPNKNEAGNKVLQDYNNYANDVVGLLAFNLAITCLGFKENGRQLALVSLVVVSITLFRKGFQYKKYLRELGFKTIILHNPVYFIGVLSLFFATIYKLPLN